MDYGEISYQKVCDLEKYVTKLNKSSFEFSALEKSNLHYDQIVSNSKTISFQNFSAKIGSSFCFQLKLDLVADSVQTTEISVVLNGFIVHKELIEFSGEKSIGISRIFEALFDISELSLVIKTNSSITISAYSIVCLGLFDTSSTTFFDNNLCVSSVLVGVDNLVAVSYVKDGMLYVFNSTKTDILENGISESSFSAHKLAECGCVSFTSNGDLYTFRCDSNNNLYYANFLTPSDETLIAQNVISFACVPALANSSFKMLLVFLDSEGKVFITEFFNNMFSTPTELEFGVTKNINKVFLTAGLSLYYVFALLDDGMVVCKNSIVEATVPDGIHSISVLATVSCVEI